MRCRTNLTVPLAKLQAGIQFGHYVISFGNRPNDCENASMCEFKLLFFATKTILILLKRSEEKIL